MDAALGTAAARFAEYGGAVVLFGAPLFFLYGLVGRDGRAAARLGWPRWAYPGAALALLIGCALAVSAETATMTDEPANAWRLSEIWRVVTGSAVGAGMGTRLTLAALGLLAGLLPGSFFQRVLLTIMGGAALASFAWTGHGAMDDGAAGAIHLGADLIHLLAAGLWLGALGALLALSTSRKVQADLLALQALHTGLRRFAGAGTLAVALLVATGLVNSWFLIGPDHLPTLVSTLYGKLLLAKLALFAAMLILAAMNRYRHTPNLGAALLDRSPVRSLGSLQLSLAIETMVALGVMALVGLLGTLAPASMA